MSVKINTVFVFTILACSLMLISVINLAQQSTCSGVDDRITFYESYANLPSFLSRGVLIYGIGDFDILDHNPREFETTVHTVETAVHANLRTSPSTNGHILDSVPPGTILQVDAVTGSGWLRTWYQNQLAYIADSTIVSLELFDIVTINSQTRTPYQEITIIPGLGGCFDPTVILQTPSQTYVQVIINGTDILFNGSIAITIDSNNHMNVTVLSGSAHFDQFSLPYGITISIPLNPSTSQIAGLWSGSHEMTENERIELTAKIYLIRAVLTQEENETDVETSTINADAIDNPTDTTANDVSRVAQTSTSTTDSMESTELTDHPPPSSDSQGNLPPQSRPQPSGTVNDTDGDGVSNSEDECTDTYGSGLNGCIVDTDGDGIDDYFDTCPDRGDTVDANGCPLDIDHDGIPDDIDACPRQNRNVGSDGCPKEGDDDGVVPIGAPDDDAVSSEGAIITDEENDTSEPVPDPRIYCQTYTGEDPPQTGAGAGSSTVAFALSAPDIFNLESWQSIISCTEDAQEIESAPPEVMTTDGSQAFEVVRGNVPIQKADIQNAVISIYVPSAEIIRANIDAIEHAQYLLSVVEELEAAGTSVSVDQLQGLSDAQIAGLLEEARATDTPMPRSILPIPTEREQYSGGGDSSGGVFAPPERNFPTNTPTPTPTLPIVTSVPDYNTPVGGAPPVCC